MNNERGIALLATIFFLLALSVLGTAFVVRSVTESRIAQKHASSTQAFWLADAGVQQATWDLTNNSCTGFVQCGTATACVSCSSCGSGSKCLAGSLGSNGDYDVTLNSVNTLISSTGSYPSRTATNRVLRNVQVVVSGSSLFSYAAFAQDSISLSNNVNTDSYDSASGDYGGGNINSNGSIGTNGTDISLSNNVTVNGNASTGAGGSVDMDNNASVTGTTTYTNNVTLSPVTVPSALTGLSSSGTISGTATISAGDYKYAAVSLSNNKTLTIDGDVRLYLTGSSSLSTGNNVTLNISAGSSLTIYSAGTIAMGNNSVVNNVGKIPASFIIYSTYTGGNGVSLSNNGAMYGAVYAPQTDVVISNNGDTYGALVGKTVNVTNNGDVHYDEALSAISGGSGYSTSNWNEF